MKTLLVLALTFFILFICSSNSFGQDILNSKENFIYLFDGTILPEKEIRFSEENFLGSYQMSDYKGNIIEKKDIKFYQRANELYANIGGTGFALRIESGHYNIYKYSPKKLSGITSFYFNKGVESPKNINRENILDLEWTNPSFTSKETEKIENLRKKLKRKILAQRVTTVSGLSMLLFGLITQNSQPYGIRILLVGFVVTVSSTLISRRAKKNMLSLIEKYNEFVE